MNVEYTQRNYELTPAIRKQIDNGIKKLAKILGDNFETKVILVVEKHRHKAELTLTSRNRGQLVGAAVSPVDMASAVIEALDRIESQAIKNKGRWRNLKRKPKDKSYTGEETPAPKGARASAAAAASGAAISVPVAVHSFPNVAKTTVAHLVRSDDSVALRPMKLEEAIKECEFRDREVFVFRDAKNEVKVLHRRKDGKLELIEVP
jgi:putative sigma-54 modulation protein